MDGHPISIDDETERLPPESEIRLYFRLIGVQVRSQLQYRLTFLMDLASQGLATALWFCSLALVMQRFHRLGGWSIGEVAFLYGMVEMAFGSMDLVFSGFDPDVFGEVVRLGTFDQIMIRPIGLTLQVMGSKFVLRRWGRIIEGAVIFGLALNLVQIHWTSEKLIFLPIAYFSIFCFFGGIYIVGSTLTFWTVQGLEAVNILSYGVSEMVAYPMSIYGDGIRQVFTYLIPAVLLNYAPAVYILDKTDPLCLPPYARFLTPLAGIGMLAAASIFWRYGVRHYQSTGS